MKKLSKLAEIVKVAQGSYASNGSIGIEGSEGSIVAFSYDHEIDSIKIENMPETISVVENRGYVTILSDGVPDVCVHIGLMQKIKGYIVLTVLWYPYNSAFKFKEIIYLKED